MGYPNIMVPGRPQLLTVDGVPVPLDLPRLPSESGKARLLVSAHAAEDGEQFGVWEFALARPFNTGRVIVSAGHLDQSFLILDHPNCPPLGIVRCLKSPSPHTGAIDLRLMVSGTFGDTVLTYRLGWADEEARRSCLARWRQDVTPPIDWFYVELTSHCNLACPFCPSKDLQRARAFMPLDRVRTIFGKIGDYVRRRQATWGYSQSERMVFLHVMGEPLLHPRFIDCVKIAKEAGLVPALFTNATLLDARNTNKIFESGLTHVTVSLNVGDQGGYSALGARGSIFEQEQRVAAFLRERARLGAQRLHIDIQYMVGANRSVVGQGLIHERSQAWEMYRHWLLQVRDLDHIEDRCTERRPVVDLRALEDPLQEQADPSLRLALSPGVDFVLKSGCSFGNTVVPHGMRVVPAHVGRCPFDNPNRQMAIYVDGSVSFCNLDFENSLNLGNLLEQEIEEIWSSDRLQRVRHNMMANVVTEAVCQRCLGSLVSAKATPDPES